MVTDLASCKGKLLYFRMKELKDVLTKLGLPKQGRKQDLVERILHLLSNEAVAKIIEDTYRKMQIPEAADLASMGQSGFDICNANLKAEAEDSLNSDAKICCPCGTSLPIESMVQCVAPTCLVQQHISCVIIPEKPTEEIPSLSPLFFCQMCRVKRADPFWVTVAQLVSPMKLVASNIPTDGANLMQNAEATFQLTKEERDLLQNNEYDVQAWCILLNDKVSFRMQWLQYAELCVNGLFVTTTNRPGTQLLGANGRDDGAIITLYIVKGVNKISLSGCDARSFCFGVRLVKRRTVEQVLNLIPKETAGELFEDALARVHRCIGGGMATGNEDSDSDLEVIADSITVDLRCPMGGSRIKVAGRFKPCVHMRCFDLETFVALNECARKWQCPICIKNYSLEDVIIDPYFYRITTMMRDCTEDITDIEVKPDGSWRVKTKGVHDKLAKWHLPDGSPCVSNSDALRPIKEESSSRNTIIARIKENLSANIEVCKQQPVTLSPKNRIEDNMESYGEKVVCMTSSASGSSRDNDDPGINQECSGYIDLSSNSFNKISQVPHSFDPTTCGIKNQMSSMARNTDVIVLSDSEEENDNVAPPTTYQSFCAIDNTPAEITESYLQDPALDTSESSCFGLFSGNVDDAGISSWPYTLGNGAGSGFQLFDAVSNVSEAFIGLEHVSASCSAPMNGFTSASMSTIPPGREVIDSPICHANVDMDDHLIDNTMAFVDEDPSLQNFLTPQPTSLFSESELGQHLPTGIRPGNWISLRLGSNGVRGGVGSLSQSASTNGLEMRSSSRSNEASLNGEPKSNGTDDRKTSDGPFSFPRQPRSVRQRVHLP